MTDPKTPERPALRDDLLEDLADIALRDPRWALARAYEFGYSAGLYIGRNEILDELAPLRKDPPCG